MNKLLPAILLFLISFSYTSAAIPLFSDSDPVSVEDNPTNYIISNNNIKVQINKDNNRDKYYSAEDGNVLGLQHIMMRYWNSAQEKWVVTDTNFTTEVLNHSDQEATIRRTYSKIINDVDTKVFSVTYTLKSSHPLKMSLDFNAPFTKIYDVVYLFADLTGDKNFATPHGVKLGDSLQKWNTIIDWGDVWESKGKNFKKKWWKVGDKRVLMLDLNIGLINEGENYQLDPAIGSGLYSTPIDYRAATIATDADTSFAAMTKGTGGINVTKTTDARAATPTFTSIDFNLFADSGGTWEQQKMLYDSTNNKIIITTVDDARKDLNITECSNTNTCLNIGDYSGNSLGITDANMVGTGSYDCDVNSGGWLVCVWAEGTAGGTSVLMYGWDTGSNVADDNSAWVTGDILVASNIRSVNLRIDNNSIWEISYTTGDAGTTTARYINYSGDTGFSSPIDFGTLNTDIDFPFGITRTPDGNTSIGIEGAAIWHLSCGNGLECSTIGNWDYNSGFADSGTSWNGGISSDGDSNVFIFYPDATPNIKIVRRNPEYYWESPITLASNTDNKLSISQTSQDYGYQDYLYLDSGTVYWDTFPVTAGGGAGEWINADFITNPDPLTPIDPENDVNFSTPDLNGTSTYSSGITLTSWEWTVDLNVISTDQNTIYDFNMNADFNVCLNVGGIDGSSNDYNDMECKSIHLSQYPQDVNYTYLPANPSIHTDVNFYGEATDPNILTWNWGFPDGNGTNDQNVITQFSTSGNNGVCLTVDDNESLSRQTCNTIYLTGTLRMAFSDENTGAILIPNISIDGNTDYSVNGDGVLSVNLSGWTAGIHTVRAWDNNHTARYWSFDLTESSSIDINAVLLDTNKGKDVEFQFHEADLTYIDNALITLFINDVNHASIRQTNTTGEVTFFLNPQDQNYYFSIDTNGTDYNYFLTETTIKIPKDESSLTTITPFTITISGISDYSFPYNTADVTVPLFPDTVDYHIFDVNATGYYSRTYSEIFEGGLESYNLQPYLVSTTGGVNPNFHVFNYYTKETIPDVLIISRKSIGGTLTIVETAVTDSTGRAQLSFIQGDTYYLEFWYQSELKFGATLVPDSSTDYYVYLDLLELTSTSLVYYPISISFFPEDGEVDEGDTGMIHLEQDVSTDYNNISEVRIQIIYDVNTILFDENYSGAGVSDGNLYTQDINTQSLQTYLLIRVEVTVTTTYGQFFDSMPYHINSGARYNLFRSLQALTGVFNQTTTTLIAIFITIFAVGTLTLKGFGMESSFFVAAGIMGLFAWIQWVDLTIYLVGLTMGSIVIILLKLTSMR